LDLIAAREQGVVAVQRVEDQALVGLGRRLAVGQLVEHLELDRAQPHQRPGILAARTRATPSVGSIVSTSWLGRTPTEPSRANAMCGTSCSVTASSVTVRARRLPVRR